MWLPRLTSFFPFKFSRQPAVLMPAGLHISLAAEPVATFGGISITNSLITGLIGSVIIFTLFYLAARAIKLAPQGGLVGVVEYITESLLDLVQQVTNDRRKTQLFFPLLMTLLIFILINNWLGLLPGVGPITVATSHGETPLFRASTADLNTTLALALISVVLTQIYAIRELGVIPHLRKYVSWNPIMLFVGLLEAIAEFAKVISFSFRLFGNIFAGEVLLVVIAFLVPPLAPLPFFFLELFVGFVQALVFTMLTLVFLTIATSDHNSHNETSADSDEQLPREQKAQATA